jgi:hypothetical protein
VAMLVADWYGLSEELRRRRVNDAARRLAAERRAVTGPSVAGPGMQLSGVLGKIGVFLVVLLVGFGIRVSFKQWAAMHPDTPTVKPLIADYDAYERERAERAAHVCEATRSRVMRGATVGPSDVEGWVIELWALRSASRPSLAADPALGAFVSPGSGQTKGRIVWPNAAPSLAGADGAGTEVTVTESNLPETGTPSLRGIRLVMSGHYVVPYFNEPERQDYLRFARVLTDALGVDYAGLYARCASGTSHQIGSWFRGPTSGGALAALLFFMGVYADHPDLRASVLLPPGGTNMDPAFALKNLIATATPVKKARILELVAADGGMVTGTDDQVSTITFPYRDGNRAGRASHVAARELGIGEGR